MTWILVMALGAGCARNGCTTPVVAPSTNGPATLVCNVDFSRAAREPSQLRCDDPAIRTQDGRAFEVPARVGLAIVVPKKPDGTGLHTQAAVDADIAFVNKYFAAANIAFFRASYTVSDTIPLEVKNTIGNDSIFARKSKTLPVLYVQKLTIDGQEVGGIAWNNGSGVVVWSTSGPWNVILAHELGHALGLAHTDLCAGDGVADTPPDPGPNNYDCATGTSRGTCNLPTSCLEPVCNACDAICQTAVEPKPDVRNIMSHFQGPCRRFTLGQAELMRCTLRNQQSRLLDVELPPNQWWVDPIGGAPVQFGLRPLYCSGGRVSPPATIPAPALFRDGGGPIISLDAAGLKAWELKSFPKKSRVEVTFNGPTLDRYVVHEIRHQPAHVGILHADYDPQTGIASRAWIVRDDNTTLDIVGRRRDSLVSTLRLCGATQLRGWVIGITSGTAIDVSEFRLIEPKP
jgi:hypothetical protein